MKKLFAFIFWPALAGLIFAVTLLQAPKLVSVLPGLAAYFPPPAPIAQNVAAPSAFSFSDAIRRSAPAVVSINYKETAGLARGLLPDNTLAVIEDNRGSLGSGVIIRPDGYIITSYHVVFSNDANRLYLNREWIVTLQDGTNFDARVVSLDEKNDLALLKIDAESLPSLEPAGLNDLRQGDLVLAIGNPRNIGQSVTQGIISALWRQEDSFVIQTDAAINPGNSGGALVNTKGQLIGINSTIVSESGGSEGIGFSIPAEKGVKLLEQYLASGPSGYLGVDAYGLSLADGRQRFGQDVQGIEVFGVTPGSPADKAGLRVGDVITGVGNTKIVIRNPKARDEADAAVRAITNQPPGELIALEVFREGMLVQVPVILGVGEPQIYDALVPDTELPAPAAIN